MRKQQVYIKSITLDREEFMLINKRIDSRYAQLGHDFCFIDFREWSLFATIFGIFTSYGNIESTKFFLECMKYNYLPKISITERKNRVKICICIMQEELNEKKSEYDDIVK